MSDSDPIKITNKPDDLIWVGIDMFAHIQFKLIGLIFLAYILLSSSVFINRILSTINGAVDYKNPTSYGVILQGILLVIIFVVLDILIKQKII